MPPLHNVSLHVDDEPRVARNVYRERFIHASHDHFDTRPRYRRDSER